MNGYIDDLLKIRESFLKYQELCSDKLKIKNDKWFSLLDKTDWFFHIQCAIDTANLILKSLKVIYYIKL